MSYERKVPCAVKRTTLGDIQVASLKRIFKPGGGGSGGAGLRSYTGKGFVGTGGSKSKESSQKELSQS